VVGVRASIDLFPLSQPVHLTASCQPIKELARSCKPLHLHRLERYTSTKIPLLPRYCLLGVCIKDRRHVFATVLQVGLGEVVTALLFLFFSQWNCFIFVFLLNRSSSKFLPDLFPGCLFFSLSRTI
jgi:hypothetical protein